MTAFLRPRGVRALVAGAVVCVFSSLAVAQPPDVLRSYRFLPRLSTLTETGGIAGVHVDYKVGGTYGFAIGYDYQRPDLRRSAKFVDVDAWAAHPILAYVRNVDETLGLSTLKGEIVPAGAPFDVFKFTGHARHGERVELYTAQIGRWMLLRGETAPPCCDFFKYELRAVARQRPLSDLTNDGEVDRRDFAAWSRGFGYAAADDPTGDGKLTGADFLRLQRDLGESPPDFSSVDATISALIAASPTASSVPEPTTMALVLAAAGALAVGVRRRR